MFLLDTTRTERIAELRRQLILQVWMPWIITSIIVSILVYVASAVGLMKMFEKAGEKNWKAWIPFYNTYLLFKMCWKTVWFWPIVGGMAFIAIFGNLKVGSPWSVIFAVLIVIVLIGIFVIRCILANYIAKAFGKSAGWTVGLIFVGWLFYLLLGFGEAKFKDAPAPKKPEAKASPAKPKKPALKPRPSAKKSEAKKAKTPKKKQPDYIDPKPKAHF